MDHTLLTVEETTHLIEINKATREELESAIVKVFSFDDWKENDRVFSKIIDQSSCSKFMRAGYLDEYMSYGGDSLRIFILRQDELDKIMEYKKQIADTIIEAYFEQKKNDFLSTYDKSLERTHLINDEIEKVRKTLEDKQYENNTRFDLRHGGINISKIQVPSLFSDKTVKVVNTWPDLFNRYIVRGEIYYHGIKYYDQEEMSLPGALGVHVLHKYKQFLECEMVEMMGQNNKPTDISEFQKAFMSANDMHTALDAAKKAGMIDEETSHWCSPLLFKTKVISAFWFASRSTQLARTEIAANKLSKISTDQFGIPFGKNAVNLRENPGESEEEYREFYKALLGFMRAGKT